MNENNILIGQPAKDAMEEYNPINIFLKGGEIDISTGFPSETFPYEVVSKEEIIEYGCRNYLAANGEGELSKIYIEGEIGTGKFWAYQAPSHVELRWKELRLYTLPDGRSAEVFDWRDEIKSLAELGAEYKIEVREWDSPALMEICN